MSAMNRSSARDIVCARPKQEWLPPTTERLVAFFLILAAYPIILGLVMAASIACDRWFG